MDKKSDAKSAPTKHKIPVGQAETKTTKSQTTKSKSDSAKASSKTDAKTSSGSSAVKVTRKSGVKPLTAAVHARPIKVADAKTARTAQGAPSTGTTPKTGSTTPTMTPKTVTLGASGGATRSASSPASRPAHTQAASTNRPKRPRKQSRKWWLIGGIILAVLVVIGIVVLLFWLNRDTQEPADDTSDQTSEQLEIDYNQKVTNPLGGSFSPIYQQGSNADFAVRFVDLNCSDDQCSNVKNVKFAGKALASDAYTVKRGSVIVVLKADTMKNLKVGQYTLSFEIDEEGKTQLIGVRVKVTSSEGTCPEGQTMQDGQCTNGKAEDDEKPEADKPDQKPEDSKPDDNGSNNGQDSDDDAAGNNAGSNNTAQNECEKQAGPIKVLTGKWLSDDEKQAYAMDAAFQEGDEIAVGGTTWSAGTSMKTGANGSCQPSVKGAEKSNDVTISDWLLPRSSSIFPETTRNHPYQNFVVWYYPNGATQLEFVSGDPTQYILNHL